MIKVPTDNRFMDYKVMLLDRIIFSALKKAKEHGAFILKVRGKDVKIETRHTFNDIENFCLNDILGMSKAEDAAGWNK